MAQSTEPHVDETVQLRTVEAALQRKFAGRVPDETISREVHLGLEEFSTAPVRTFVPLLLQKRVADRLRQLHPA